MLKSITVVLEKKKTDQKRDRRQTRGDQNSSRVTAKVSSYGTSIVIMKPKHSKAKKS